MSDRGCQHVQATLDLPPPRQKNNERFMPLDKFADQVMAIFRQTPTPSEILVEGVDFMRDAEKEGRMDAAVAAISPLLPQR